MACVTAGDTMLFLILQGIARAHLSADEIHDELRPDHHPPE